MKILFISDMIAEKNTGGAILSLQHLETIKTIFGEKNVKSIIICENKERFALDDNKFEVYFSYKNKFNMIKNSINLNYPLMNNKIEKRIMEIITMEKIDVVFFDNSMYGNTIKKIKHKFKDIKVVTFFHDIKKDLFKQHLNNYGIKFYPKYITGIYNENKSVKYSDKTIVLSRREKSLFEQIYNQTPNEIIPIYSKDKYLNDSESREVIKKRALFVGGYYYPNVKGIKWFIENVVEELDIELDIVGYNMEKLRYEISNDKVNIIGSVDNVRPFYERASFIVAPIFEGGGMKTKVAEALMYGKVILGTDEAFEGYDFDKKEYAFICNKKEDFINVINNQLNYEKIKANKDDIRNIYLDNYSENAIKKKMCTILEK